MPAGPARAGVARRVVKGLTSWLKGALITLGVMYVVTGLVLTFGIASIDAMIWRPGNFAGTMQKTTIADGARGFGLPPDASITPERAGQAFVALRDGEEKPGKFPFRTAAARRAASWRTWTLDPALFPTAKPTSYRLPNSMTILGAVKRGFSAKEREVLRAIATAPIWHEYDLVARAPAADLIGARFALPFPSDATVFELPTIRFAATKEMAYASVARAAWHLSEGRRDSAEFALRSTISFGRVLSDNAPFVIDQLIGAVITGIGREALVQLYTITGDTRGPALAGTAGKSAQVAASMAIPLPLEGLGQGNLASTRRQLLEIAASPSLSRSTRYEALASLAVSSCTNMGELLTGPNASVRAAFDQARRDLARYPSEVALIDLIAESLQRPEALVGGLAGELTPSRVLVLAGKAYFNPRLASCGLMLMSGGRAF